MSDNSNLRRILEMMRILYQETDDNHYMNTYEIIDALEEAGQQRPDRKIIDPYIKFLAEEMGFGLYKEKGSPNKYGWVSREFDLAELKMLVDAVQSSRFISESQSRTIIEKLKGLTSKYEAVKLDREIYSSNSFKRKSGNTLYSIDAINEAIKGNTRITFQVADYNTEFREVLRHDGKKYDISPYALLWHNDYYYMLGKPIDEDRIRQFRVDRMKNIESLDEPSEKCPASFNLDKYSGRVFDMFTGETVTVTLDCDVSMMNYLVDRFGQEFKVLNSDDDRFVASITLDASPTFYSWVFQFGGLIKIIGPDKCVEEFQNMLKKQATRD